MKPRGKLVVAAIMAVGALGFARPGFATDFTFVVPVNLSHIPSEFSNFQLNCWVYSHGTPIGNGASFPRLVGGAFSGDVTVAFNASAGHDPATADQYSCRGSFIITTTSSSTLYFDLDDSGSLRSPSLTFPLQPGASFVLVTGRQPLH